MLSLLASVGTKHSCGAYTYMQANTQIKQILNIFLKVSQSLVTLIL